MHIEQINPGANPQLTHELKLPAAAAAAAACRRAAVAHGTKNPPIRFELDSARMSERIDTGLGDR